MNHAAYYVNVSTFKKQPLIIYRLYTVGCSKV